MIILLEQLVPYSNRFPKHFFSPRFRFEELGTAASVVWCQEISPRWPRVCFAAWSLRASSELRDRYCSSSEEISLIRNFGGPRSELLLVPVDISKRIILSVLSLGDFPWGATEAWISRKVRQDREGEGIRFAHSAYPRVIGSANSNGQCRFRDVMMFVMGTHDAETCLGCIREMGYEGGSTTAVISKSCVVSVALFEHHNSLQLVRGLPKYSIGWKTDKLDASFFLQKYVVTVGSRGRAKISELTFQAGVDSGVVRGLGRYVGVGHETVLFLFSTILRSKT